MWRTRIRNIILSFGILLSIASPLTLMKPDKVQAVSASDWSAGRIIDDSVFFNPNTMSSDEIQAFFVSKESGCTGTCLKNYSQSVPSTPADAFCGAIPGGNMSAATIIKLASAACVVNPAALIVLLQKEQSLVTDTNPSAGKYQIATGYGCPDSAPVCDSQYYGFFNQVYLAARQFQRYVKQPQLFNYRVGQTSNVQWSPNGACGSTPVYMQNSATAALYNYTPYQPNQAALNAGFGYGDGCSAYGNRNFWLYFWSWFGNPIGAEYAWSIDSFTYSNGDNVLTTGYSETMTLKARNISRQPWYNHGDHPIRLGTWKPENRSSNLLPTRLATLQESVVQPNEVGTFQFQIAPSTQGTFVEALNLVAENYAWMSWPGFSPTLIVTNNPYQWRADSVTYGNGTGVMDSGSTQSMVVRATNTGNVTWNKSSPPIWLGTWGPDRSSGVASPGSGKWPSTTRITQFNETTVAPGQQASFQFDVQMPSGGNYYEHLNLVAEGQSWFNDSSLILYLHGKVYSWQPVWSSLSTGNPNIGRNQTFNITVRALNNGELTWTKNGSYPMRLGTSNPLNRGSGLYYGPSWLSDTRATGLVESSVAPGGYGTFTFTARAPATPGPRYEHFNLVAEGLQWLPDPGFNIYINSL